MECIQCRLHFCWLCNQKIKGYEHYGEEGECNGKGFYILNERQKTILWEQSFNRKFQIPPKQNNIVTTPPLLTSPLLTPNIVQSPPRRKKSKLKSAGKFGLYAVGFVVSPSIIII